MMMGLFKLSILLVILPKVHFSFLLPRNDIISNIDSGSTTNQGGWKPEVYCPEGSFAKYYRHTTDLEYINYDKSGTQNLILECYDYDNNKIATVKSNDIYAGVESETAGCANSDQFLQGINLKVGPAFVAVTSITMYCSDKSEKPNSLFYNNPDSPSQNGDWITPVFCPSGSAFCGFQSLFDDYNAHADDSALNNLNMFCCLTCDPASSKYADADYLLCLNCHYSCKKCKGGASTDCTDCFHNDALIAGACVPQKVLYEALTSGLTGWTSNPSYPATTKCGYIEGILGGYSQFGVGAFAEVTISNLPPHFKKRVRIRFLKIDSWQPATVKVYSDSDQIITQAFTANQNYLFGDLCGDSNYPEYSTVLTTEYLGDTPTVKIKVLTDINKPSTVESWGITDFYFSTVKCHYSCKSCSDEGSNSCKSCYPPAILQPDNTCLCPDRYSIIVSSIECTETIPCSSCSTCHSSCKTCNGLADTNCLSCDTGKYLDSGKCGSSCSTSKWIDSSTNACVDACPQLHYYGDILDKKCKPCDNTCLTCSGPGTNACLSCESPLFQQNWGISAVSCVADCTPLMADTSTRNCVQKCPPPTWGSFLTNTCNDQCSSLYYYKDPSTRMCRLCHITCATCDGPANYDCLSCSGSLFLYGGSCLIDCGEGKFGDLSKNICKPCDLNCKTCVTTSTKCLSCSPPKYLQKNTNSCVNSCLDGFYKEESSRSCQICDNSCEKCFGGSSKECLTCKTSTYLNENDSTCVPVCPAPYFAQDTNLRCMKTCASPNFGTQIQRKCKSNCDGALEFADPSDRICKSCNVNCRTCQGITDFDCLTCAAPKFLKVNTCVSDCGDDYFADTNDNTCKKCSVQCKTCSAPSDPNSCLTCYTPLLLQLGNCVSSCSAPKFADIDILKCSASCSDPHKYPDIASRKCLTCDNTCLECDGPGNELCKSCSFPYYLLGKKCTLNCKSPVQGLWENSMTRTCDNCHSNCFQCSSGGENDCTECLAGKYLFGSICVSECPVSPVKLYKDSSTKQCVKNCKPMSFPDEEKKSCEHCHPSCLSCKDNSITGCLSCDLGYYLTPSKGTCGKKCDDGFFSKRLENGDYEKICYACDSTCLTCKDQKDSCLTCNKFYYPVFGNRRKCIACNGVQEFIDPLDNYCKVCFVYNCKRCKTMKLCEACLEGYYIQTVQDSDFCLKKINIAIDIKSVNNPKLFTIEFNEVWFNLIDQLNDSTPIEINTLSKSDFSFKFERQSNSKLLNLRMNYLINVPPNSELTISVPQPNSEDANAYEILNKTLKISLKEFKICDKEKYWNFEKNLCENKIAITPALDPITDPQIVHLRFDEALPDRLANEFESNTQIAIAEYNYSYLHEYIFFPSDPHTVAIKLNFSRSFINQPQFIFSFNLTNTLEEDDSFYLTKKLLEARLPEYYLLSESNKNLLKTTSESTEKGAQLAQTFMILQNILNIGSSFAVKSLVLMELIRFLRYIQISYPPNVKEMFLTDFQPPDLLRLLNIVPKIKIDIPSDDTDTEGLFEYYGVSNFILNNHGSFMMSCLIFIIVGFIIQFISNRIKNSQMKLVGVVFTILKAIFVWNYVISMFLTSYQTSLLYTAVAYRWVSFRTPLDRLNFAIALLLSLLLILAPVFVYLKIIKMRNAGNKVMDIIENNLNQAVKNSKNNSSLSSISNVSKDKSRGFSFQMFKKKTFAGHVPTANQRPRIVSIEDKCLKKEKTANNLVTFSEEKIKLSEESHTIKESLGSIINIPLSNNGLGSTEKNLHNEKAEADPQFPIKSSFVNLWDVFKKKPKKTNIIKTLFGDEPEEEPARKKTTSFKEKMSLIYRRVSTFFGQNAEPKQSKLQQEGKPESLQKGEEIIIPEVVKKTKTLKKKQTVGFQLSEDTEKDLKNNNYDTRSHSDRKEDEEEDKADIGKKTFGHIVPWEASVKDLGEIKELRDGEKPGKKTKFGRKSKGKITPWDEFSSSTSLMRQSLYRALQTIQDAQEEVQLSKSKTLDIDERFKILHKDFKTDSKFRHFFLIYDLLRQLIIVFTLFAFYNFPMTCITLVTLANLSILILLITLKPFASRTSLFQNVINELCLDFACIGAFYLGILDKMNIDDSEHRFKIGWIIVGANLALIYFFMLVCIIEFGTMTVRFIRTFYNFYRVIHLKRLKNSEEFLYKRQMLKQLGAK